MVVDVVEVVVSSGTVVSAADVVVSRVVEPPADVVVVSGRVAGSISKVEVVPSEAFNDACVLVVPAIDRVVVDTKESTGRVVDASKVVTSPDKEDVVAVFKVVVVSRVVVASKDVVVFTVEVVVSGRVVAFSEVVVDVDVVVLTGIDVVVVEPRVEKTTRVVVT